MFHINGNCFHFQVFYTSCQYTCFPVLYTVNFCLFQNIFHFQLLFQCFRTWQKENPWNELQCHNNYYQHKSGTGKSLPIWLSFCLIKDLLQFHVPVCKHWVLTSYAAETKTVQFANSTDLEEAAQSKPSHLDEYCLPSSLLILNKIGLNEIFLKLCRRKVCRLLFSD